MFPSANSEKLPLHLRLRPRMLGHVIGQADAVASLGRQFARTDRNHLYLFSGPAGTGKTTLARILADQLGAKNPLEIDGPSHAGIDDMRELREYVQYQNLDGSPKVVVIDECHALSKAAWQAALKIMEEPPSFVYFALCTTEHTKVPTAIQTRAHKVTLQPVASPTLVEYGNEVIKKEGIAIPDNAIRYIVAAANGSVRNMLMDIARCEGARDLLEVQRLLEEPIDAEDAQRTLNQLLVGNRRSLKRAHKLLCKVREANNNAESVRIAMIEYVTKVYMNPENDPQTGLIPLLNMLSQPIPERGGWAALCSILFEVLRDEK